MLDEGGGAYLKLAFEGTAEFGQMLETQCGGNLFDPRSLKQKFSRG
jgi:hypothetical protein